MSGIGNAEEQNKAYQQMVSQFQKQAQMMELLQRQLESEQKNNTILQQQLSQGQVAINQMVPNKPVVLAPAKPDIFNGNRRMQADVWLFALEQYFNATEVTDANQKIRFAVAQLRESALNWWRRMEQIGDNNILNDWQAFKTSFTGHFMPVSTKEAARTALHNSRQRTTVSNYCDIFNYYLIQLNDNDMSASDQLYLFKRGLVREIQDRINMMRPNSLSEAMSLAQQIELEGRMYQRQNFTFNRNRTNNYHGQRNNQYGQHRQYNNQGSVPMEISALNEQHEEQDYPIDISQETDNYDTTNINTSSSEEERNMHYNQLYELYSSVSTNNNFRKLTPEQHRELLRKGACFNCHQSGHMARFCPNRNRQSAPTARPTPQQPKKY